MRPAVGKYRSVVIFCPSERVSSVRPSGVVAEPRIFVDGVMVTLTALSCFVAVFETLGGVPSRT